MMRDINALKENMMINQLEVRDEYTLLKGTHMREKTDTQRLIEAKWKIEPCFAGDKCWCRTIVPTEKMYYNTKGEPDEMYVIGTGVIGKEMAQHIVSTHNQYIDDNAEAIRMHKLYTP